jgi:protoporphyrinogen oxidase
VSGGCMTSADMDADAGIVIVGAGPAGLTAAYALGRRGVASTVLEADAQVGGLSRTVEREGWRFDIGGHRFFTRLPQIEQLWAEFLEPDEFPRQDRVSHILYNGKLFDYPLHLPNVLRQLGVVEAARCLLSYLTVRVAPPSDQSHFEGWVTARFGRRLYRKFFKTYTEKVWGVPATEIQADWAAQRIKNLSLLQAVVDALTRDRGRNVTSLIRQFRYPSYGPGMMWERAAEKVTQLGGAVLLNAPVVRVERSPAGVRRVSVLHQGVHRAYPVSQLISSMPLPDLILAMDPPAPEPVRAAATALRHRDFLTVAVVVPKEAGFRDHWIYVHTPAVRVARIQNFGSWSPYLVRSGRTCLGLEYFSSACEALWTLSDDELVSLATAELETLGIAPARSVQAGYVVRAPKAYPVYDRHYAGNVAVVRAWLDAEVPNVHPVGRNGMHRYNNQDHSMWTALLTVENLLDGTEHDVWTVNVDADYHEGRPGTGTGGQGENGTGRAAPLLPLTPATASRSPAAPADVPGRACGGR